MRLIFMGTPEFSVPILERLIAGGQDILAVYTQPDKPVGRSRTPSPPPAKQAALKYNLVVRQPQRLREPAVIQELSHLEPEAIIVAAFGQILPPAVLQIPPLGCLNVHPSLLPHYRGPSPVAATILAGDTITGVTIMLMDSGIDSGPILAQREVAINPEDTTASLTGKLALIGARLLEETLPLWQEHRLTPQPQEEARATYSRLIAKENGNIDWQLPAEEIWGQVRAFQPWPGSYTYWEGKLLKLIEVFPLHGEEGEPGRVVALGNQAGVHTGRGILGLRCLQLEGKRTIGIEEFLRGQRGFIGGLLKRG